MRHHLIPLVYVISSIVITIQIDRIKAAVFQNILNNHWLQSFLNISLNIYNIIYKPIYFHFFALKTDNSLFCYRDIPTIHNGYCVSNAVDYAKKNDVLPTICQLN